MKLFIALFSLIAILAWAQEEKVDQNDPSMQIGMGPSNVTEADFNDNTKAHQMAQRSFGQDTTANCPHCAKQGAMHEQPDDGAAGGLTDSSGNRVKDGSGNDVRTTQ